MGERGWAVQPEATADRHVRVCRKHQTTLREADTGDLLCPAGGGHKCNTDFVVLDRAKGRIVGGPPADELAQAEKQEKFMEPIRSTREDIKPGTKKQGGATAGADFDKEVERQTVRFLRHLKLVQGERDIYDREDVQISFNSFLRLGAMAPDLANRVAERVRESITLSEEQPA